MSGLPASGKSSLAERIAAELGWPLFTKDRFKELLYDAGSFDPLEFDRPASGVLGRQAIAVLIDVATTLIRNNVSLVIESNFRPHLARPDLAPLLELANGRQVHCMLERSEIVDRYRSRFEHRERHPVHLDSVAIEELEAQIDAGYGEPIPLNVPLLSVNTQDGYHPSFQQIVDFCRQP